jgi:hypothetical protein
VRRLALVVVLSAVFFFGTTNPTDIDFWWHLKTGEIIATTRAVPTTDPFSYTVPGRPWTAHEWLWELAAYGVYRVGGYGLAAVLSALVVTLTFGLLYRLLRQLGVNEYVALGLVLWAGLLAVPSIGVRPRELTHLFLVVYLGRLLLYRQGRIARLWALPAIMLVWVNVHGPFILGLAVLGVFVAGATVGWLLRGQPAPRHLWAVGLATLAATVVNPTGPAMLLYPVGYYLQGENPSFAHVTEFRSPDFHQPLYLVFALGLVAFMLLGVNQRRFDLVDSLLVAAFTLQALVSVRHVPVAALVLAPLLACRLRERFVGAREWGPPAASAPLVLANWLLLALLVLGAVVYAGRPDAPRRWRLGPEPSARAMPVEGARFVEERGLPGPVFNHQPWGGYLIARWYPERRVFIDGRVDMYGPGVVGEYLEVVNVRPGWREVLDKYGVRTLLIEKDSALSTLLLADGGWERVFQGEVEDVFVRKASSSSGETAPGAGEDRAP